MEYERLTVKQEVQLIRLCKEFQPYLPFDEIVFMELVSAAREYCDGSMFPFLGDKGKRSQEVVGKSVSKIKGKYYYCGFKSPNKPLSATQLVMLHRYVPRVKMPSLGFNDMRTYRPIEKVLFVKIVRACRDYMRAKMSKEAEESFFEKLNIVYDAMKR